MEKAPPKKGIWVGQTVYLVESCRFIREAVVRRRDGALCTIRFTDTGGGIRVREGRLYPTREAAQTYVQQLKEARQPPQPPSFLWHNVPLWQC